MNAWLKFIYQILILKRHGRAGSGQGVPGRAGEGRFIRDFGSTSKNNSFLFHEPHSYIQYFMCFDSVLFSHDALCVDRWDASRRVSLLRSVKKIQKLDSYKDTYVRTQRCSKLT